MSFKHTAETDARIRQGYEAGERVLDIANALGVSRNVVIGRAGRIGLARTGTNFGGIGTKYISPEGRKRAIEASKRFWAEQEGYRDMMREVGRQVSTAAHANPETHNRIMTALQAGRARYWAARKAAQ